MRRVLALLVPFLLIPGVARGEAADRPIVLGVGDRLSGAVPVAFVGDPHDAAAATLRRLLDDLTARTGLAFPLTFSGSLREAAPTGPLVVCAAPPRGPEAVALAARLYTRGGAAIVLRAPLADPPAPLTVSTPVEPLSAGLPIDGIRLVRAFRLAGARSPCLLSTPDTSPSAAIVLLAVRAAVLPDRGVRWVPTAFGAVTGRDEGDSLSLSVRLALEGTVTMDLLTIEGQTVLPPGPVRPIPLAAVSDPEGTLVRLRFQGESGLRDEARFWLPDLLPTRRISVRVEGAARVAPGEPPMFRLFVSGMDERPLTGFRVEADLAGNPVVAESDAGGAAILRFPPFPAGEAGERKLRVRVTGARSEKTLEASVEVAPPATRLLVETDRPVYRAGGLATVRVTAVDELRGTARGDLPVRLTVTDPRDTEILALSLTTDSFGTTVFEVPLADALPEGSYRLIATADEATGGASFRLRDLALPAFLVEVALTPPAARPGEAVRATVHAATLTGEPLVGAEVQVDLVPNGAPPGASAVTDASGAARVSLDVPPESARDAELRITVTHAGSRVVKTAHLSIPPEQPPRIELRTEPAPLLAGIPGRVEVLVRGSDGEPTPATVRVEVSGLPSAEGDAPGGAFAVDVPPPAGPLRAEIRAVLRNGRELRLRRAIAVGRGLLITAPPFVNPGQRIPVSIRGTPRTGPVVVDLAAGERILAGATVALSDGSGSAEIEVPADAAGPAELVARFPGDLRLRSARLPIDLAMAALRLSIEVDRADARPGEDVILTARATGEDGAGRPVLLDLRAFDRAYLDVAKGPAPDLGQLLAGGGGSGRPSVLASTDAGRARLVLSSRAARAAAAVLAAAVADAEAGRPVGGIAPWGAPVLYAAEMRRGATVFCEPPVTDTPAGVPARGFRSPVCRTSRFATPGGAFPAVPLLPAARGDDRWLAGGFAWLGARYSDGPPSFNMSEIFRAAASIDGADMDLSLTPASSALALLAYFGAGETHKHGRHKATVRAGLRHLCSWQDDDGFFGDREAPAALLNHAVCALAIVEHYALTASPLTRNRAANAIRALAREQLPDGSFAEAGSARGSLVVSAWAASALKSARAAGLPEPEGALPRLHRWVIGNADPATGAVSPSGDEVARYPFRATERPAQAAAMTAAIRIFAGEEPRRSEALDRLSRVLLDHLPVWDEAVGVDLHGIFWGTIVCFQIGGDVWKTWNEALKTTVIDHQERAGNGCGYWDPPGPLGVLPNTAFALMCMEVYYRYSRVFGSKDGGPEVRSDFPDLMAADLGWRTGEDGAASRTLRLPGSLTTWEVRAGAWDGKGGYARAEAKVRASLPFSVDFDLPARLFTGDRLRVPVRVRTSRPAEVVATLEVSAAEGLAVEPAAATVTVPAGGTALLWLDATAGEPGPARLRVTARAGDDADAVERTAVVRDPGGPLQVFALATPGVPLSLRDELPADAHGLRASLTVSGGSLADLSAGLEGLIRRPTGCFEQTSATMYPALLAHRFLARTGTASPELLRKARLFLLEGYQRVRGFTVEGGGFSLYGKEPADPALTALAIHLLTALAPVLEVDGRLVERAADFLAANLPDDPAERLYSAAALRLAGRGAPRVAAGRSAYALAMAVLYDLPVDREAARRAIEGAARRSGPAVRFAPGAPTLFAGHVVGSEVEMTALAARALSALGARPEFIGGALQALREDRWGDGGWGTTRETVAALEALVALSDPPPASGTLIAEVSDGGRLTAAVAGSSEHRFDLGPWKRESTLLVRFEGTGTPFATLAVEGASRSPQSDGPMSVAVEWPEEDLEPGVPCTASVRVWMKAGQRVHAPVVVVPLPAGFRADARRTGDAAARGGFDRAEVRPGEVWLYLAALTAGSRPHLELPLLPGAVGTFSTGAARVYPYYEPSAATVCPSHTVTVARPGGK